MTDSAGVPPQPTDADHQQALRQRFHEGDADAFQELVAPWVDDVYTLCLRLTSNAADAEDLAQEALIRALNKHRYYAPDRPLRPWLLTIAANLARSRMRTVWWKRVLPFSRDVELDKPQPDAQVASMDEDAKVRHALTTLPLIYREAVALFHLDGMSYREMAEITGVAVPALKQRVRRGNGLLRTAIAKLYPDMADTRKTREP